MSHNDDFWSGSQNDPYGNQPGEQSPSFGGFGDPGYGQPGGQQQGDPFGGDPYRQDPYGAPTQQDPYGQDPFGQDPYGQDPYGQDQGRRKLLATGPHDFDQSWGPIDDDPFEDSFTPGGGRGRRDDFSAGRGGRGFIAAFILAAVVVALAAGAYAVYSVLQDEGGGDDTATGLDSTTSSTSTSSTTSTTATTVPEGLAVQLQSSDFVCDGTVREFGTISGATPEEEIAFSSPQSPNLSSGQADVNGQLPIRWSCGPEQIGTIWELTATGVTSGLSATVTFTGVAEGEASATGESDSGSDGEETTAGAAGEFAISIDENPFACNGEARVFGTLTGATPNGSISFTSPQADNIRSGTADGSGSTQVRWQCSSDQSGTVWQLTATDDTTGNTVVWELTGE